MKAFGLQVARNTASQFGGKLLSAALAVLGIALLTNFLGVAMYGRFAAVYEFLAFFAALADFGLFTVAIREAGRTEKNRVFGAALALRLVLIGLGCGAAVAFAALLPSFWEGGLMLPVVLVAVSSALALGAGTLAIALGMRLCMHVHAAALVGGKLLSVALIAVLVSPLVAPLATPEQVFLLLFGAGIVAELATLAAVYGGLRSRGVRIRPQFSPLTRRLFADALPVALATALATLSLRADVTLLTLLLPFSENGQCAHQMCADLEVGRYALGMRLFEVLSTFPMFLLTSVLAALTAARGAKFSAIFAKTAYWLAVFGLFAGGAMMALSHEVALFLGGADFADLPDAPGTPTALRILGLMLPVFALSSALSFVLLARFRHRAVACSQLLAAVANIGGNLLAIPQFGFVGAAYVSLATQLLLLAALTFCARDLLTRAAVILGLRGAAVGLFAAAAALGAAATFMVPAPTRLGALLTIGIASIAGLAAMWAGDRVVRRG